MSEHESLHAASSAIARLDERLRTDPLAPALARWAVTQDAVGVAAWEGLGVREADLASVLANGDLLHDKAIRVARGVHDALSLAHSWRGPRPPTPEQVSDCVRRSDAMNVSRDQGTEGQVDNDAFDLCSRLEGITSPDPWTAAAGVREVLSSRRFRGRGRRVAFFVAPFLVATGFGAARAALPIAPALHAEGGLPLLDSTEEWASAFFAAVARSASRSYDALATFGRLAEEGRTALGKRKVTSRSDAMVRCFLGSPVQTVNGLVSALDATHTGTSNLVRELMEAGVVSPYGPGRSKGRQYVMRKALGA